MSYPSSYWQVEEQRENVVIINKSKFITTLAPINNYDEAIQLIKIISKKYSDATHNCYAFVSNAIATEQKFSDDGEPQGTAGNPMLEVLKKRNFRLTLAVVTRYFGGIKLGAGGLVSAYSSSVAEALDKAKTVEKKWSIRVCVVADYNYYKKIETLCDDCKGRVINIDYANNVLVWVAIPYENFQDFKTKIADLSLGKAVLQSKEECYYGY